MYNACQYVDIFEHITLLKPYDTKARSSKDRPTPCFFEFITKEPCLEGLNGVMAFTANGYNFGHFTANG